MDRIKCKLLTKAAPIGLIDLRRVKMRLDQSNLSMGAPVFRFQQRHGDF